MKNTSKASKPLKIGETLVLDCPVDGIPIPSYKWYKDTKEVATGKKYSIKIDGDKAFGIYICKASNKAGVKNFSFTITRHSKSTFLLHSGVGEISCASKSVGKVA